MDLLPACPRFQPIGLPPPVVLSSGQAAQAIADAKATNPAMTTFVLAIYSQKNDAWRMTVEEAQPNVPPNEAVVVLENQVGWDKAATTVDSRDCNAAGKLLNVAGGKRDMMRILSGNTTTLVLSKPACTFWFLACWSKAWVDVAVFAESNFWTLFGGRIVTFTWLTD